MKRADNLYEILISDDNLREAIITVNRTHRWYSHHRPNMTVQRVDADIDGHIKALRKIIERGFEPFPPSIQKRWDKSAGKWRNISTPRLWPDQYVHHALIQALEPVFMRGMDNWCCGSIKGRGTSKGAAGIKRWMRDDVKGTKYCVEADIYHFYDSLTADVVMERMRELIKDSRVLAVIERTIRDGILIGAYYSQWLANVTLQPLDALIRQHSSVKHYSRYMDNFTIFSNNKREMRKLLRSIGAWLNKRGLKLKGNWQVFPTKCRMPCAMGFRYGRGFTLLKKRSVLRFKRACAAITKRIAAGKNISANAAAGLLSRAGAFVHCEAKHVRDDHMKGISVKFLKNIIRRQSWILTQQERFYTRGRLASTCA